MDLHSILVSISDRYLWFLLLIVVLNLSQRKFMPRCMKKRNATLLLAVLAMVLEILITVILVQELPDYLAFVALGIVLLAGFLLRRYTWPFRLHCPRCGARLKWNEIIGSDGNICDSCYKKEHPEEFPEPEDPSIPRSVDGIDWENWEADQKCVITYLFRDTENGKEVLMIDKKTGLGNGLVNVPGGHIEADETAVEAAIREFKEETDLDILQPEHVGVLHFQFLDGTTLMGHVYFSHQYSGQIRETEEARGFWCPVKDIPYDRMWEDDRYWLPEALKGIRFNLVSIFDDREMLSIKVTRIEEDD